MVTTSQYQQAVRFHNRGTRCLEEGEPVRAGKLLERALSIKQALFGPLHEEVALTQANLGLCYKNSGNLRQARNCYESALSILRERVGASHAVVASVIYNMAQLLKAEAKSMERWAKETSKAAAEMTPAGRTRRAVIRDTLAGYPLRLGPSRIHRYGVFAEQAIPADVRIMEYTGDRVSRQEAVRRSKSRVYLCRLDSYWSVDGSVNGSGAELMNHCCEPNCRFDREAGGIWVASLRAIEPGEELLLDYRFPKNGPVVQCFCGAASCRGTINVQ